MNGHLASVKAGKNLYIYQHFNLPGRNFDNATIQIIDCVDSSSINPKRDLHDLESFWASTLCTAYPLGLNDNTKGMGNISKSSITDIYFKTPIKRYKRGHGRKKNREKKMFAINDIEKEILELKNILKLNKNIFYRKIFLYQIL